MATDSVDVFVSYSRADKTEVDKWVKFLAETCFLSIWSDSAIVPGDIFDEEIDRRLNAARSVLVCWSENSVTSQWVRAEAKIAADQHKLVPVFLAPCRLPPPFNLVHTEDMTTGWTNVVRQIGILVGRGAELDKLALTNYMQKQALLATTLSNLAGMRYEMLKHVAENLREPDQSDKTPGHGAKARRNRTPR